VKRWDIADKDKENLIRAVMADVVTPIVASQPTIGLVANISDSISRKWLLECVEEEWVKFDTEKDKNIFIHLVRDIAPSAGIKAEWGTNG
jgi:hypothetical protein